MTIIFFFNNSLNKCICLFVFHFLIFFFFLKYSGSQEKVTQSKDSVNEDNWCTTFKQILENGTHGRGDEMKDMLQISLRSLDKPSHFGKMCCPLQFPLQISEDLYYFQDSVEVNGFPLQAIQCFFLLSVQFRLLCAGNINLRHFKRNTKITLTELTGQNSRQACWIDS